MAGSEWNDMDDTKKAAVVMAGVVQVTLLVAALVDLYRRPAEAVRGPKLPWVLVSFVNIVGPLSYFIFGRKS